MKPQRAVDQLSLFVAEADQAETLAVIQSAPTRNILPAIAPDDPITRIASPTVTLGNALTLPASRWHKTQADVCPGHEPLECEWSAFLRQHDRVPTITDEKKPWQYPGWLLYYRLLLEEHPNVGRRWDYWCRTMMAGEMLGEPIPQLSFCQFGDKEVFKAVERWIRLVDRFCGGWSAIDKLLDWFLWGFGYLKTEPQLPPELNESLYREVNIGPMLLAPYDYFGEWIAMQKGKWNPNAFYPTPHNLVECMVRMVMEEAEDARAKTVLDPCVGSGRMLMHASNYSLRLYGIDIDPAMVKLTCLNGGLYVPWLLRPFPESFFTNHGTESQSVLPQARRA